MRYLYRRGKDARRRVMHLCGYNPWTGKPTMAALCGRDGRFDTTSNVPFGLRTCKDCIAQVEQQGGEGQ